MGRRCLITLSVTLKQRTSKPFLYPYISGLNFLPNGQITSDERLEFRLRQLFSYNNSVEMKMIASYVKVPLANLEILSFSHFNFLFLFPFLSPGFNEEVIRLGSSLDSRR